MLWNFGDDLKDMNSVLESISAALQDADTGSLPSLRRSEKVSRPEIERQGQSLDDRRGRPWNSNLHDWRKEKITFHPQQKSH